MTREPCVYILASRRQGTLYIGVTSDLLARLYQHRNRAFEGFTARHHVHRLVHFEMYDDMEAAIAREKQLKSWRRAWKIALIEEHNPFWEDRGRGARVRAVADTFRHWITVIPGLIRDP